MDYLLISSVYILLETFLLITLRILGFFLVAPVFGGSQTPSGVKITLSFATAFIIMTTQSVIYKPASASLLSFAGVGLKELSTGLIMGFSIYFLLSMFYYVGQMVDFQIGFSMVSVFDPINQLQIPISGNLFYLTITLLLILAGAHYNFFRALFYSYQVIPLGAADILNERLYQTAIELFGVFFMFGFRIALPIVGTILVLEIALGILNRAAPQMHIFSVGMSLKILVGLAIIYIVYPLFSAITESVFIEINRALYTIIRGMVP